MAVYLITSKDGTKRLIETRTKAGAINHVASKDYTAEALNTRELVQQIQAGLNVETVEAEKPAEKTAAKDPNKTTAEGKAPEGSGIPKFAKSQQSTPGKAA